MAEQSTYVRKIGEQQFEYGIVRRAKNFRKRSDVFAPLGIKSTVATAVEAAESELAVLNERRR